jgi:hypothetical protein
MLLTLPMLLGADAAPSANVPEPPSFLTAEQRVPLASFGEALEANVAQHTEYMATLDEKYIGALDTARTKMVKLGATRAVTALNGEIDRIEAGDTVRSSEIDSAPDYVRKMRDQYDQFIGRVNNLKRSRDGAARFAAVDSFGSLQSELTKASEIDKAMQLRNFRKALARPPAARKKPPVDVPPDPDPSSDPSPDPVYIPDPDPEPSYGSDQDVPRVITASEMERFAASLPPRPTTSGRKYPVMVASIQKRDVTEIQLSKIKSWGKARLQMWRGKPYWTATVTYPTTSLFGTFDTEGMAIIDGDRVVEWLYTGSGEEIP